MTGVQTCALPIWTVVAGQAIATSFVAGLQQLSLITTPSVEAAVFRPMSSSARLHFPEPGLYEVRGIVRLNASRVTIEGITNAQQISWSSGSQTDQPVASFSSYETVETLSAASEITVNGGEITALSVIPMYING